MQVCSVRPAALILVTTLLIQYILDLFHLYSQLYVIVPLALFTCTLINPFFTLSSPYVPPH